MSKESCTFENKFLPPEEDTNPCGGKMTKHHVLYRSESGPDTPSNLIPMCEFHQYFVHSTNEWGDENFDDLIIKED